MIRTWMWFFVYGPAFLFLSACGLIPGNALRGSGRVESETREVSGFDEIDVCCGMQLSLSQGQSESLVIEAEDNILPEIISEITGSKLIVRFDDSTGTVNIRPTRPVRVTVSAIEIRGVTLSGGGSLEAGPVESDQVSVDLSGGSQAEFQALRASRLEVGVSGGGRVSAHNLQVNDLSLDFTGGSNASIRELQGENLELEATGGGSVEVAGSVTGQAISLSGGVEYQAGDLESQSAEIVMTGGGQATIWVNETLDADLSGGAQVNYYGSPQVTQRLTGGSQLESRGER